MLSNLLGKNAPNYLEGKGRFLDDASIFLLAFLMYMEYASRNRRWRVHRKGEIAKRTGLTDTTVKEAIKTLTDNGLVYWYHDRGYRVNLDLVLGQYEPGLPTDVGSGWSMLAFTALGDIFFNSQARKEKAGRISYQEKLLALSLIAVADEAGRVEGFDPERQGRRLGIKADEINECLDVLQFTYGFVLSYTPTLPLEEGFIHSIGVVNLNLAHPWLLGGKLGFYAYCQMHRALVLVTSDDQGDAQAANQNTVILDRQPWAYDNFAQAIQDCRYNQWLKITRLRKRKAAIACAEKAEVAPAEEMPEISNVPKLMPELDRLQSHWEIEGITFISRCNQIHTNTFEACLQLALALVGGQQLDVDSISDMRKQCLEKLDEHPLLGQWREFLQGSLKHHYLEMLRVGTAWAVGWLLDEACKALRAHPDFGVSEIKKLEVRLATYLFDTRLIVDRGSNAQKNKLTGVLLFRVEKTWNAEVWGMDIPTDEYMESIFGKGKYTIKFPKYQARKKTKGKGQVQGKGSETISVCSHYKNSQEATRALISELKEMAPSPLPKTKASTQKRLKKKSSVVLPGVAVSWMDFIENHAEELW